MAATRLESLKRAANMFHVGVASIVSYFIPHRSGRQKILPPAMSSFGPRPIALAFMYIYISFEWSEPLKVSNSGALTAQPRIMPERLLHTQQAYSRRFPFFLSNLGASVWPPPRIFYLCGRRRCRELEMQLTNVDSCLFFLAAGEETQTSAVSSDTHQGHPAAPLAPAGSYV